MKALPARVTSWAARFRVDDEVRSGAKLIELAVRLYGLDPGNDLIDAILLGEVETSRELVDLQRQLAAGIPVEWALAYRSAS